MARSISNQQAQLASAEPARKDPAMYRLTVKGLSFEAAALILVGFIAGLMFDSWRVVIAVQVAFVAFEFATYVVEAWRRRRGGRAAKVRIPD
jgi:hypothetical protein